MSDQELRKWCLERAFDTRDITGFTQMAVTSVAEGYYIWITHGKNQENLLGNLLKQRKRL